MGAQPNPAVVRISQTVLDDASVNGTSDWQTHPARGAPLYCGVEGWRQAFRYLDPASGSNTEVSVEFVFNPPEDGCYLLEEFHPRSACTRSFSPEVPLAIHYCKGGVKLTEVDQTQNGNQWNSVGIYPFYLGIPGKVIVSHPQVGNELAVADAFRFTYVAATCNGAALKASQFVRLAQNPVAVIVDDHQALSSGYVTSDACARKAFAGSLQVARGGEASAEFTFEPPSTGCYRVDTFHPENADCSFPLAPHTIVDVNWCLGQHSRLTMPLSGEGNHWNTVGHFKFYAGEKGSVVSRRMASLNFQQYWVADAVRFTRVADSCHETSDAGLLSLRIFGPEIDRLHASIVHNGLTSYPDMVIALHDAIVEATQLPSDSVHLLGLRNGSIILDVEVRGTKSIVTEALSAISLKVSDNGENDFKLALCKAVLATESCGVEIVHVRHVPGSGGILEGTDGGTTTAQKANLPHVRILPHVPVVCIVAFLMVLALALILVIIFIRRRRKQKIHWEDPVEIIGDDIDNGKGTKIAVVPKESVDDEVASTATPASDRVDVEVMSVASGDHVALTHSSSPSSNDQESEP